MSRWRKVKQERRKYGFDEGQTIFDDNRDFTLEEKINIAARCFTSTAVGHTLAPLDNFLQVAACQWVDRVDASRSLSLALLHLAAAAQTATNELDYLWIDRTSGSILLRVVYALLLCSLIK
ncbi:hypothetical protein ACI65C_000753 [Semiaphis heraclei]